MTREMPMGNDWFLADGMGGARADRDAARDLVQDLHGLSEIVVGTAAQAIIGTFLAPTALGSSGVLPAMCAGWTIDLPSGEKLMVSYQ